MRKYLWWGLISLPYGKRRRHNGSGFVPFFPVYLQSCGLGIIFSRFTSKSAGTRKHLFKLPELLTLAVPYFLSFEVCLAQQPSTGFSLVIKPRRSLHFNTLSPSRSTQKSHETTMFNLLTFVRFFVYGQSFVVHTSP